MASSYHSGSEISAGAFVAPSETSQKETKRPLTFKIVKQAIAALKEKDGSSLKDIARYVLNTYGNKLGTDSKEVAKVLQSTIKRAVQREALAMSKGGKFKLGRAPEEADRRRRRRGRSKGKKGKKGKKGRRRRRGKKGKKGKKGKGKKGRGRRRRRRRGRKGKKGKK